jgi:hypothetical protein
MDNSNSLKSILLLTANPKGTSSLRLQEEEREIRERLRLAGYGKVPINSTGATRPRDIQQAMLDFKPQIVHFSGHGTGQNGLAFEDAIGQEKLVSSEALANLFKLFSKRVECVVLNACYSEFQARAIAQYIDYVIGMSQDIGDRAAIEFSVGFYTALGAGESIELAYEVGCNAIELEGISEKLTPVFYKKNSDLLKSSQILLENREPVSSWIEHDNPLLVRNQNDTLTFANIAIDKLDLNWMEVSNNSRSSFFGVECKHYFQLRGLVYDANLNLDITLLNLSPDPIILTAVGLELIKVAQVIYLYGIPQVAKVYKTDSYSLDLPNLRERLHEFSKDNLFGYDTKSFDLNEMVFVNVEDPVYLESKAPYRYQLLLKEYQERILNHAILCLWVRTNVGEFRSELIEIFTN